MDTKKFGAPVVQGKRPASEGNLWLVEDFKKPELLTVKEVAARLRLCAATVFKLCATGELRHIRIINNIRIRPADLEAFIAERMKGKLRQPVSG